MTSQLSYNAMRDDIVKEVNPSSQMRELTDQLDFMREVSDALWQTTATLGLTIDTLDVLDDTLACLKSTSGSDGVKAIEKILNEATLNGNNLLTQSRQMEVLTHAGLEKGKRAKVFQTIMASNLSLESGPFQVARNGAGNAVRIMAGEGFNAHGLFTELENIAISLTGPDGSSAQVSINLVWAKTPKAMCNLIHAVLSTRFPDFGDIPISFDGNSLFIGPTDGIMVNSVSLQGPKSGALAPVKNILMSDHRDAASLMGAVDLARRAVQKAKKLYMDEQRRISRIEEMTLNIMERIALVTILPHSKTSTEGPDLIQLKASQMVANNKADITNINPELLGLLNEKSTLH